MQDTIFDILLKRVAIRSKLVLLGRKFYIFNLIFSGAFLLLLLASRLLGVISDYFSLLSLLFVPFISILCAIIFYKPLGKTSIAKLIDEFADTKDLFLTAVMLGGEEELASLVKSNVLQKSENIDAKKVVGFAFVKPLMKLLVTITILLVCVLCIPQFDPFNYSGKREEVNKKKKELAKTIKYIDLKKKIIINKLATGKNSELIKATINDLLQNFKSMQKKAIRDNRSKLVKQQKTIGALWKNKRKNKMSKKTKQAISRQLFGADAMDNKKIAEWMQQLQQGKNDAVDREMKKMQEMAKKIANTPNGINKEKMMQELEKRIKQMQKLAEVLKGMEMDVALQQALEQLADLQNNNGKMQKEMMKALQNALELSELENKKILQDMQDMKDLGDALKAIQMANMLNEKGELKGENAGDIKKYMELYKKRMLALGMGKNNSKNDEKNKNNSKGVAGRGIGQGRKAKEDDTIKTAFQDQKLNSQLQAGKILMEWSTNELGSKGKVDKNYLKYIKQVKQGVSEAIEDEKIPPVYRNNIKDYFKDIEKVKLSENKVK